MLAPKGSTYNERSTFANPMYLKKAQSEKPCLYEIPYDQSDLANIFSPDKKETLTLEQENRSKLNKDLVKPYDYIKQNNLQYVQSLEKEIAELESDKADFSNIYDLLLQECVSKDVMCSYLHSLSDLYAHTELVYLYKIKECKCLAEKLSKQTKSVSKEVYNELLRSFAKLKQHSISLEIALQQYLKAHLQDKNIAISELKKLIEKMKGKSVDTKFDKPSVVRQPNALRILKLSVLGKPTPFSYSLERKSFSKTKPQLKSNQMKDKVVPNNNHVKFKKTEIEDHHRISSISNKTKSVTACNDSLKSRTSNVNAIIQLILFIVDSGCTKHMTGNLKLLCNFVEKYLGTIHFENDQFAPILSYGDLVQGNIMIKRVYYVEGLNHNLFLGNDLLTGNHGSDLYTISQDTTSPTPICFMAKASPTQAWLWHRRLSHLNFDSINLLSKKDIVNGLPKLKYAKDQLCSSCELGKEKRSTFKTKIVPNSKGRLNLLHMDLCDPMRIESINGKKYILVIVDDYSRYTWTLFLRTKDETPEVLKDFLKMIQRNIQAQVITVHTDRDYDNSGLAPQLQKTSDHNHSELKTHDHSNEPSISTLVLNVSPPADTNAPSLQELDLLFNPLFEEHFTAGNQSVSKSSSLSDNSKKQDTQPTTNIQPTT
ncbi:retrovirus-related pol polyprotein from transposon TNT 1-94 [Tanacetum coccineum]